MDFKERKMDFREADRRHDELVRKREAGEINDRQFDDGRKKLSVRDDEGRWWAKSAKTGEWRYYDGKEWVPGAPPGYQPRRESPGEEGASETSSESVSPPPRETGRSGGKIRIDGASGAAVRERVSEPPRRGRRRYGRWVVLAVGLAAAVWGGVSLFGGGFGAAYALVEDESGNLSVEAPSDWDDLIMEDSEGEKGRASWTSWIGLGDVGSSLTAVNGLDGWRTGADGHQGMYMFASKELASWDHEYLVAAGPNDYWETCEGGEIQDFNRGEYSGKVLQWKNCGGESGHVAVTLSASPENPECVVVMQIGGYFQTEDDEAKIQNVLDTFEADCA